MRQHPRPVDLILPFVTLQHPAILESRLWPWPDEAACDACAQALAQRAGLADAVIELHGPLGAGKTSFVRCLLRALGFSGRVRSPTFTVLEPYAFGGTDGQAWRVAHLDLYRFNDPREWLDAGLRDEFEQPGLKLIEWPERAAGWLPPPDMQMHIAVADEAQNAATGADPARRVRAQACTERGLRLLG